MQLGVRLILLFTGLFFLPISHSLPPPHSPASGLSSLDRRDGAVAARLADRSSRHALRWLRGRASVVWAQPGRDGTTIEARFRDGGTLAILSPHRGRMALRPVIARSLRGRFRPHAGTVSGRAIVLEPFADELGLGPTAGQAERDALAQAGFAVDVALNGQVTVGLMEQLADYSVVYMETHSGVLPNGDAIVVTGETANDPYASLYQDGSLQQAYVAGQANPILYNAITARFVTKHMATFPNSGIVFLNGCKVLSAPVFVAAMRRQGVAALISWDRNVSSADAERAAAFVLTHLAAGDSVQSDLASADAAGLGTTVGDEGTTHLGFFGDGDDTLPKALAGATPTPTPTPTATATDTPIPLSFEVLSVRAERHGSKPDISLLRAPLKKVKVRTKVYLSIYVLVRSAPPGSTGTNEFRLTSAGRVVLHRTTQMTISSTGTATYRGTTTFQATKPGMYAFRGTVTVNGEIKQRSTTIHVVK